jgi:hypothetical protein
MSPTVEEGVVSKETEALGSVGEWLSELGLAQYINAFSSSGFDDLQLLSTLNERDLDSIEAFSSTRILPGHRKKVLLASQVLAGSEGVELQNDTKQERQMQLPGGVGSFESPRSNKQSASRSLTSDHGSSSSKPSTGILAESLVTWLPPPQPKPLIPPSPPLSLAPAHSSEPPPQNNNPSPPRHRLSYSSSLAPPPPAPTPPLSKPTVITSSSETKPSESQAVLNEVKEMIKQLSKRDKSPKRSQANRASAPTSLLPTPSNPTSASDAVMSQKREELEALHGALESKFNMLKGDPARAPKPPISAKQTAVLQLSPSMETLGVSEIERKIRAKIEEVNRVLAEEEGAASTSKVSGIRAPSPQLQLKRPSDDQPVSPSGSHPDVAALVATRKKMKSLNEIDREIQAKLQNNVM